MIVYTAELTRVRLASELARGGEAVVYRVSGRPDQLAKIYSKPRAESHDKMRYMRSTPPSDPTLSLGHASIAWPRELLYDSERRFVGYVMPFIEQAVPIVSVFNPRRRARVLPGFDGAYLHRAARNLSSALAALHSRGYVVGDLNERNVLVTPRALVTLIDTDSFQVQHPTASTIIVYPCPVGRSEYTPPELQGRAFREVLRRAEHDCFGLGVLIYQLLMSGSHPFRGMWRGSDDPPPIETRIKNGWFPHGTAAPKELVPPSDRPGLDSLHPHVADLFMRCFADGHLVPSRRPTATEWSRALAESERHLVVCTNDHPFPDHLKRCPVCNARRKWGRNQPPIAHEKAAAVPSVPGVVTHVGGGAAAAAPSGTTLVTALARVGRGAAAPIVATTAAVRRARRSLSRAVESSQRKMELLPQRIAFAALFHAGRPRATVEALRHGSRRLARHVGLAAAAAGAGILTVALLDVGGLLSVAPATAVLPPGTASLALGAITMMLVGLFRGLSLAPEGRVTLPLLRQSMLRAAAGVAGAVLGWITLSLVLGLFAGNSPNQMLLASTLDGAAPDRILAWALGWSLYGAIAGTFGGALRPSTGGWATSGFVFGASGSIAMRFLALLLHV